MNMIGSQKVQSSSATIQDVDAENAISKIRIIIASNEVETFSCHYTFFKAIWHMAKPSCCSNFLRFQPSWLLKSYSSFSQKKEVSLHAKSNICNFRWKKCYFYIHSLPEMCSRKVVLKICRKFAGEHPCQSAISIKLLCNFIGISFRYSCSPINFCIC